MERSIKGAGFEPWGLAEKKLVPALAVSAELGFPTLLICGNTSAGVDVGFICEAGEVTYAKIPALPNGLIVFENGAARHETPQAEEFDEEGEPLLDEFQFATEVANRFFGTAIRWRVTSDFATADYTLVAGR